jgi:hypothetical protein
MSTFLGEHGQHVLALIKQHCIPIHIGDQGVIRSATLHRVTRGSLNHAEVVVRFVSCRAAPTSAHTGTLQTMLGRCGLDALRCGPENRPSPKPHDVVDGFCYHSAKRPFIHRLVVVRREVFPLHIETQLLTRYRIETGSPRGSTQHAMRPERSISCRESITCRESGE